MLPIVSLVSYFSILALQPVTAQYLPNAQALTIKELEHLYLDSAPSGILSAITPCSNYFDPSTGASNNGLGRQTAAEWIRTAFRKSLRQAFSARRVFNLIKAIQINDPFIIEFDSTDFLPGSTQFP